MSMKVYISNEIKEIVPEITLGVINYTVQIGKSSENFLNYFDEVVKGIEGKYETADIAEIKTVQETRDAYKKLGKSPSRHRNAAESMLRRIVKGDGLYKINNAVDINNLISVTTGYSIGSYDRNKLSGDIELRHAAEDETYQGIGKSEINIASLPVLYDLKGSFGSPTSDSQRAMLQDGEKEVMSIVYAFNDNKSDVLKVLEEYQYLLETYTSASSISAEVV